jgi:NAD(P)-dependent dehydrogenase (short-subunit alcohol dehydrogenase family)
MKRSILITGSTDGVGKLTALRMAMEGHQVYLHGRNAKKVADVVEELKSASGNKYVAGFVSDFSDLNSVKQFAQEVKEQVPQLDVLINNAGVFKSPNFLNHDGLDIRFVVNYLAPYLLTNELFPLLKKGNDARIINLSSAAQSTISYNAMMANEKVSENAAYAMSKLALTMWSFYLAEEQKDIAVIAVNPGSLLNTKMANEAYGTHWSSADKGVDIVHELALDPSHQSKSGQYFDNDSGVYARAHQDAYDSDAVQRLISTTKKLIKEL